MKKLLITLLLAIASNVYATTVPFQNITLNPGQNLRASYSFGAQFVIFCFAANTNMTGSINWPYQGRPQSSTLPVLLKINSRFEGQWADPNGVISITNTSGSAIQVGCLFAY